MARKILLADDSVTAQNMGRKILADAGYEVITVNNGSAALKKIAETKPDLIVLDVYMPGYSGLEVCQRLKEAGETSRIPILLTVGKLEPFKPEEAKRVRADGYIVKPFEASELLSALSKLEDKVVPRSEPSKPGRFARATAAIEENRYDKAMATDEDSGWKSRIVFPKKKEKAAETDVDDPAIYNPVNKDLRTVVEHRSQEHPPVSHAETEEERVNLGALAPEGFPKDVTPEEIAALAAAAAQVKGKIAEEQTGESKIAEEKIVDAKTAVAKPAEHQAETSATSAPAEVAAPKAEIKDETPVAEAATSPAPETTAAPPVTLAEQPASEKIAKEPEQEVAPSPSEVMAAIVGLEQQSVSAESASSGNGSGSHRRSTDEPVTMAVAAAAVVGASSPRWTAVAVALAPEEASISLEQEMQKANASFAVAAESAPAEVAPASPEPAALSLPPVESSTPVPEAIPEPTPAHVAEELATPVARIEEAPAPEAPSSFAEMASAAKEAVAAAVTELASVASSFLSNEPPAQAAPVTTSEALAPSVAETAAVIEAKVDEPFSPEPFKTSELPEASAETKTAEFDADRAPADQARQDQTTEPAKKIHEEKESAAPVAEIPTPVATSEVSESTPAPKEAVAEGEASVSVSPTAGGIDEMAKKESEVTAAWASWRKIRETRDPKPAPAAEPARETEEVSAPKDSAAMAVAVGAESSPEEVSANLDSDPEIASIVDSVLADMRPKIVEEIARKLGKKK